MAISEGRFDYMCTRRLKTRLSAPWANVKESVKSGQAAQLHHCNARLSYRRRSSLYIILLPNSRRISALSSFSILSNSLCTLSDNSCIYISFSFRRHTGRWLTVDGRSTRIFSISIVAKIVQMDTDFSPNWTTLTLPDECCMI